MKDLPILSYLFFTQGFLTHAKQLVDANTPTHSLTHSPRHTHTHGQRQAKRLLSVIKNKVLADVFKHTSLRSKIHLKTSL